MRVQSLGASHCPELCFRWRQHLCGPRPPRACTQAVDLAEEVVIDIYDNGEVYWNGQYVDSPDSVDMPELKNILYELKQAYPNQSVVIRGQRDTQHQRIVAVLNACAFAGIDQITFPSDPSIYID